jgi:hypothetical protein
VQKPLPIYVPGHTEAMFRAAARHGYRVLSSGRVGGAALLAEQYQVIKDAYETPRTAPMAAQYQKLINVARRTPLLQDLAWSAWC